MTKKTAANNPRFDSSTMTEDELVKFERETITKLAEVLPVWAQQLGPGLDMTFAGLGLALQAIDKLSCQLEAAGASDSQQRGCAITTLALSLAIPRLPEMRKQKAVRMKQIDKESAKLLIGYESRSVELVSQDFMTWYDEGGLPGFLSSLAGMVHGFGVMFEQLLDDPTKGLHDTLFLSAFNLRMSLDKVPAEMLGAIEMLGNMDRAA